MADKIRKFFEKKKVEAKFKMAGPGHKLTDSKPAPKETSKSAAQTSRAALSDEAKQAAAAALARLGGAPPKADAVNLNRSLAAIQAQVKKELEAQKLASERSESMERKPADVSLPETRREDEDEIPQVLAVQGVYFKCPLIGPEILSKDEWRVKIKEFLYEQLEAERGLTSCLIIHSCNRSKEKVGQCIETICKYLENIISNPSEEKYRKIRMSNKIYVEKVKHIEGALEFLLAAGFQRETLPFQDTQDEFLVLPEEKIDVENFNMLMDALRSAESIGLELDRNLKVLLPSEGVQRVNLPPDFFTLSPEELKKEHQSRSEKLEESLMLKTKAMREREEQRELKKYKYSLIRIKFPDGIFIQGTFGVYEQLVTVYDFIKENLASEDGTFVLHSPTGQKLSEAEFEKTLIDLHFVPTIILLFNWLEEPTTKTDSILRPETMLLMHSI
ncbi:hypothetical protein LSTR_LSTR007511 [Laodelphax striatellus]|uniref:UBX domain-containing protein n=1 Tax=Laodelphax striatellus TaxID=195883 RepID=A0A482X535_LAOST|nr:hypothetical protein LSTR_LSTR007511 [Laodelphax striatellus]